MGQRLAVLIQDRGNIPEPEPGLNRRRLLDRVEGYAVEFTHIHNKHSIFSSQAICNVAMLNPKSIAIPLQRDTELRYLRLRYVPLSVSFVQRQP